MSDKRPLSVSETLSFLKSVIHSGEQWSETCQEAFDHAQSSLRGAKSNFDLVGEFLQKMSLKTCDGHNLQMIDDETFLFRQGHVLEEIVEWTQEHRGHNIVGVADALGDLLYLVYGAAHFYGIPIDHVFREIHRTNMLKERAGDSLNKRASSIDVVKPPGWQPPRIAELLGVCRDD